MRSSQFHMRKITLVIIVAVIICTAQAEMKLCDCINSPMDTDAKVSECSAIFDALDPETSIEQRRACRKKTSPPAGGPDICYCLKASYTDQPKVMKKCEEIIEGVSEEKLIKHLRNC